MVAQDANPHSGLWGQKNHMKSLAVGKVACSGLVYPFPDVLLGTESCQPHSLVWGEHHVRMGMKNVSSSLQETVSPNLFFSLESNFLGWGISVLQDPQQWKV